MKSRVFGLDLMRAAAMISVVIAHSGVDRILGLRHGIIAVESFFVMSGFLIGEMLIRDFKDGFNFKDLRYFWIKRWFRTLPLYYAVLILRYIIIDDSIGANIIYYFLFLQNNFYGISFLPVSWTLVLEEWFYILMPLIFFLFFRRGIVTKKFYRFVIAFVIFSNLARMGWVWYSGNPYGAIVGNVPFRFDSFLIGVGLASLKLFSRNIFNKMAGIPFFGIASILLFILLFFFRAANGGDPNEADLIWMRTIWFSLISISIALIIPFFCQSTFIDKLASIGTFNYIVTWISLLSYPIYLIHLDLFRNLDKIFPDLSSLPFVVTILIKSAVAVILSLILYYAIHEPAIKLRTKIVSRKP